MSAEEILCRHCKLLLFVLPVLEKKSKRRTSMLVTCANCQHKNRIDCNEDEWNAYCEAQSAKQELELKAKMREEGFRLQTRIDTGPDEVCFIRKK